MPNMYVVWSFALLEINVPEKEKNVNLTGVLL